MKVIKKFVRKLIGGKPPVSSSGKTKKPSAKSVVKKSYSPRKTDSASVRSEKKVASESEKSGGSKPKKKSGKGRSGAARVKSGTTKKSSAQSQQKGGARSPKKGSSKSAEPEKGGAAKRAAPAGGVKHRSGRVARPAAAPASRASERKVSDTAVRPGGGYSAKERSDLCEQHKSWSADSCKVEPAEDKKRFADFDLPSEILHAVCDMKFQYCTPIQALSLEHALAGKNVAGKAQTGTGKTAAFLIAILTRYLRSPENKREQAGCPRALVIAPTRELVIQICKDAAQIGKYCNLRTLAIYGGMDYQKQRDEVLAEPIDLLVATPGRLLDYARRRVIDLSHVDTLVIDEADRMLDMGFIPDVRMIMNRLPRKDKRCTMLYSATLSKDVMRLASQWMEEPVNVEIKSDSVATDTVTQIVYVVTASEKFTVLYNLIQKYNDQRILVFCNRKSTTEGVVRNLRRRNIACDMLSGDVNQNRRLRVLEDFRAGKSKIVIATDVAGRGIHVDDVGFVINYDFPYEAEDYVHRIGRTGRAGNSGTAISFADEDESFIIPDIEEFIGEPLKCTILLGSDPLMADIPRQGTSTAPKSADIRRDSRGRDRRPPPRSNNAEKAESEKIDSKKADNVSEPKAQEQSKPSEHTPVRKERNSRSVKKTTTAPVQQEKLQKVNDAPANAPRRKARFSDEWVPGE